jgi:HlyD family secretion protein
MLDARTTRELTERVGAAAAALAQARANVARTEAAAAQAQSDLQRQQKLKGEGFIAESAVEQAELAARVQAQALAAARFAVDGAQHDLAQARAALMRAREGANAGRPGTVWPIESPVAGRVLKVLQKSEAVVGVGTPLLEIADPARLEIVVDVLSTEAVRITPGARVHIDAGSGIALAGRVRTVEPAAFTKVSALGVEEQRVNVVIDLVSPPEQWQRLGDGYRVDVRIVIAARADAVVAPVAALFRDGGDWAVFVAAGGRAAKRTIRLGARNAVEALIEEGLAAGEKLIVYPSDSVADGSRIKVIREAPPRSAAS